MRNKTRLIRVSKELDDYLIFKVNIKNNMLIPTTKVEESKELVKYLRKTQQR
jgi:hypothetical protein